MVTLARQACLAAVAVVDQAPTNHTNIKEYFSRTGFDVSPAITATGPPPTTDLRVGWAVVSDDPGS